MVKINLALQEICADKTIGIFARPARRLINHSPKVENKDSRPPHKKGKRLRDREMIQEPLYKIIHYCAALDITMFEDGHHNAVCKLNCISYIEKLTSPERSVFKGPRNNTRISLQHKSL